MNSMKIITVNSKIKHKCKIMLGVIRNLVLDFILYFVTACMRKCLIHVTSAHGTTQNHHISPEEVSKKYFMANNLQQYLHTKHIQKYYNEKI